MDDLQKKQEAIKEAFEKKAQSEKEKREARRKKRKHKKKLGRPEMPENRRKRIGDAIRAGHARKKREKLEKFDGDKDVRQQIWDWMNPLS